jgi:AcrR family transcriptional regulator
MSDRKARILAEAQAMLDEMGVDAFTIRELSRRANVAQRTLYNVFGSKEDIIASAIELHFNSLIEAAPPDVSDGGHDTLFHRSNGIVDVIVRLRRYAAAMVGVYFAPGADAKIHESLVHIWRTGAGNWMDQPAAKSLLVKMPKAQRDAVASLLMNTAYANIGDWVSGRISEAEFRRRYTVNSLIVVRSYLRPKARARADEIIAQAFADEGDQSARS